jgi:mannosyltransferase
MKIIYDDIIYSLQRSGGISLYWSQLEAHQKQDIQLLYNNHDKNIFFPTSSTAQRVKNSKSILFERYRNIFLPEKSPFVFHSSYYRYCKNKNAINITTVHDFIYEYFRHDLKSIVHRLQKKNVINNSKGIIFVSESTKNDFEKFFPRYKGEKKVIYHGIVSEYRNLGFSKEKNIIFIGGRSEYKNFLYTVQILHRLSQFRLQIIGGGPLNKKEIATLNKCIPNRYEYYQSLSNEELNVKYNKAYFLLYPSLYEGFGFPVVEAQMAGCPVVCCNISSLPEVAGEAAIFISGKNIDDDLEKISQLTDIKSYNNIVERGFKNCKRFSWKKCVEETYNFYQDVYDLYT